MRAVLHVPKEPRARVTRGVRFSLQVCTGRRKWEPPMSRWRTFATLSAVAVMGASGYSGLPRQRGENTEAPTRHEQASSYRKFFHDLLTWCKSCAKKWHRER